MHYIGSKYYMRKPMAEIINRFTAPEGEDKRDFVSLFCGSCKVESLIDCRTRIINDKQKYVSAMWNDLLNGYKFPFSVADKETWQKYKDMVLTDTVPREEYPIAAFMGTCYSLFSRWYGSFYKNVYKKDPTREYNGMNGIYKCVEAMNGNTIVLNKDYQDVPIPEDAVVLADPPYAGVSNDVWGISERFDHDRFWQYMLELVNAGHVVFVTECTAPIGWVEVYSRVKKKLSVIKHADGKLTYDEYKDCMFMHQSQLHLMGEVGRNNEEPV